MVREKRENENVLNEFYYNYLVFIFLSGVKMVVNEKVKGMNK